MSAGTPQRTRPGESLGREFLAVAAVQALLAGLALAVAWIFGPG